MQHQGPLQRSGTKSSKGMCWTELGVYSFFQIPPAQKSTEMPGLLPLHPPQDLQEGGGVEGQTRVLHSSKWK